MLLQHKRTSHLWLVHVLPVAHLHQSVLQSKKIIDYEAWLGVNSTLFQLFHRPLDVADIIDQGCHFLGEKMGEELVGLDPCIIDHISLLPSLHVWYHYCAKFLAIEEKGVILNCLLELSVRTHLEKVDWIKDVFSLEMTEHSLAFLQFVIHPDQEVGSTHCNLFRLFLQLILNAFLGLSLLDDGERGIWWEYDLIHLKRG